MITDKQTLKQFIKKYELNVEFTVTNSNPNVTYSPNSMEDSRNMHHYNVTITCGGGYFETIFSMGMGLTNEPELEDVLDCLASDAAGFENSATFEDWARNYGYDTDSRKAERVYRAVFNESRTLRNFLEFAGPNAYDELLWETEKL